MHMPVIPALRGRETDVESSLARYHNRKASFGFKEGSFLKAISGKKIQNT